MHSADQDPDARLRMITVAERLFAERGTSSVSMRQVAIEAGQRNNSAVSYHFGSRDGLVEAILAHRSGPIDARRRDLIGELEATGRLVTVWDVARIFVQPMAESVRPGHESWYLRFLADVTDEPDHHLTVSSQPPGIAWVNGQLTAQLAEAPGHVVRRRLRWMVVIALRVLADHELIAMSDTVPNTETEDVVTDLTRTLTTLLTPR